MSRLPETEQSLLRHLRAEKRQRLRNENASPYSRSGMSLIAEGIASVDGQIQSHDFDGTDRTHLGTTGWLLGWADNQPSMLVLNGVDVYADLAAKTASLAAQAATLATTVSTLATTVTNLGAAQTDIAAQLVSINALIGSQVSPAVAHVDASTFGLATGANVEKVRTTISVPSGYTQALVYATATLCAVNSTGVWDDMYLQTSINGTPLGFSVQTSVSSGSKGSATKAIAGLLTGMGSTFYVNALASSYTAAWASNANTFVNLDVTVLFLR